MGDTLSMFQNMLSFGHSFWDTLIFARKNLQVRTNDSQQQWNYNVMQLTVILFMKHSVIVTNFISQTS